MGFYDEMAADAKALIAEAGRLLTVSRPASASYAPATDTYTEGSPTTGSFSCVVLPASKGTIEAFDKRLVNGSLIDEDLRFVLAAAKDTAFAPKAGDTIEFDGFTWTVLGCTPINPAGTALIYKMGVKK